MYMYDEQTSSKVFLKMDAMRLHLTNQHRSPFVSIDRTIRHQSGTLKTRVFESRNLGFSRIFCTFWTPFSSTSSKKQL